MTIDANAATGHWPSRPGGRATVGAVWRALAAAGIDQAFVSSLESAWCRNPHAPNAKLIEDCGDHPELSPVPTLDPTVHTWRDELAHVARSGSVRMVRLLPAYGPYDLEDADEMIDEIRLAGLAVQVQTRLDDPRRQHPLAQVPDVPASAVVALARRHPATTVVIGGARGAELRAAAAEILDLKLLYADTSQCDGMDGVKLLCDAGLTDRLLFATHYPLFEIAAGLRRVLDDLDDDRAAALLGQNAARALWRRS
ncbi:MAG: amidohydrolase family protein [Fimbriimonadaceae bacterium]|nr:amidohydrolase family protein [Fimbriimonadaceae bacterium]